MKIRLTRLPISLTECLENWMFSMSTSIIPPDPNIRYDFFSCYHIRSKITECWLAETQTFLLNHEGTFGKQENIITWCWLAEAGCIKLLSRLNRILKEFRKRIVSEFVLSVNWGNATDNKRQSFGGKAKWFFHPKMCWFVALKRIGWGRLVSHEAWSCSLPDYKTESYNPRFASPESASISKVTFAYRRKKQRKFCWLVTFLW